MRKTLAFLTLLATMSLATAQESQACGAHATKATVKKTTTTRTVTNKAHRTVRHTAGATKSSGSTSYVGSSSDYYAASAANAGGNACGIVTSGNLQVVPSTYVATDLSSPSISTMNDYYSQNYTVMTTNYTSEPTNYTGARTIDLSKGVDLFSTRTVPVSPSSGIAPFPNTVWVGMHPEWKPTYTGPTGMNGRTMIYRYSSADTAGAGVQIGPFYPPSSPLAADMTGNNSGGSESYDVHLHGPDLNSRTGLVNPNVPAETVIAGPSFDPQTYDYYHNYREGNTATVGGFSTPRATSSRFNLIRPHSSSQDMSSLSVTLTPTTTNLYIPTPIMSAIDVGDALAAYLSSGSMSNTATNTATGLATPSSMLSNGVTSTASVSTTTTGCSPTGTTSSTSSSYSTDLPSR